MRGMNRNVDRVGLYDFDKSFISKIHLPSGDSQKILLIRLHCRVIRSTPHIEHCTPDLKALNEAITLADCGKNQKFKFRCLSSFRKISKLNTIFKNFLETSNNPK